MARLTRLVEKGYRWESDETMEAMETQSLLLDHAAVAKGDMQDILAASWKNVTVRSRLREARTFLTKGVKLLESIDGIEMVKLAQKWEDTGLAVEKAHEAYFLQRFGAAMRVLRLAWNKLFYATQMPTVRRTVLTASETSAYYNPMSDVREAVHKIAQDTANRADLYVEVYDSDHDLVYVAQPSAESGPGRSRQRMSQNASTRRERGVFRKLWSYDY